VGDGAAVSDAVGLGLSEGVGASVGSSVGSAVGIGVGEGVGSMPAAQAAMSRPITSVGGSRRGSRCIGSSSSVDGVIAS
jgi:hypothetical protein